MKTGLRSLSPHPVPILEQFLLWSCLAVAIHPTAIIRLMEPLFQVGVLCLAMHTKNLQSKFTQVLYIQKPPVLISIYVKIQFTIYQCFVINATLPVFHLFIPAHLSFTLLQSTFNWLQCFICASFC